MGQSRQAEHEAFLAWLLQTLQSQKIDSLLISGDIFDTATPPNYALELYYNFLKQLSLIKSLTTTIITAGNHDSISTLKAPKQLLEVLGVHVIASGDKDENILIEIKKDKTLKAIVCAVPFLRDSVIRESQRGQTISQKEKQANEGIKKYYEDIYAKAVALQGDRDIPIIAMGHLTTLGARTSESERDIYIGGTLDIGGDYLGAMFDYVALGHLHINQRVGVDHVRYSGAPIALSFSEAKNTQKVNIVSFENKVSVQGLEVPQLRRLIVLKGSAKMIMDALKKIEDRSAWIEIHLSDDNPMAANVAIRDEAAKLGLQLLALKVQKSQKQLQVKQFDAISLDELSVEEVFAKRLELENLQDKEFEKELFTKFAKVASKVEQS